MAEAAASAAGASSKRPKQVGPEPLTAAPSAPASRSASSALLGPGAGRELRAGGRSRGRRRARRARRAASSRSGPGRAVARAAQAVELGVDGRGREAFVVRDQDGAEGRELHRLDALADPWTSAWRGTSWLGTSEPRSAASRRSSCSVERRRPPARWRCAAWPRRRRCRRRARRRRGCASRSSSRAEGARAPRASGIAERPCGEVVVRDALALHDVVAGLERLGGELVGEVDRREQRAERMQAVVARAPTWRTRLSLA